MGRSITMYDLLLSCPGDVYSECYLEIKNAIDEFNKEAQRNFSIGVSLKHWSTDSYPQSGDKPQKLLNSQIVDCADAAIAIFFIFFGTPTDKYGSGTEEEIDRFMKSSKQLFLYFLDKPVPQTITDSLDYIGNRRKITALKGKYNGIYCLVNNEFELREKIINHLKMHFFNNSTNNPQIVNKWFRSDTGKEISPNELLKLGNITAQIEGNMARVEVTKPDGETIYAEMDIEKDEARNIVANGFPQEYSIDIPENLIVGKQYNNITINGTTYREEKYIFKFNGLLIVLYDVENNKIQDMTFKAPAGMKVLVNPTNKKVCLIDDSKSTLNK